MSHVGNGEHDFDGLGELKDQELAGRVKQARSEARDIIDRLEPFHISSWADLLTKLSDCLAKAEKNACWLDPAFGERRRREHVEETVKTLPALSESEMQLLGVARSVRRALLFPVYFPIKFFRKASAL